MTDLFPIPRYYHPLDALVLQCGHVRILVLAYYAGKPLSLRHGFVYYGEDAMIFSCTDHRRYVMVTDVLRRPL